MILSVCDYSGSWSQPFRDLGFTTVRVDPKLTTDLTEPDITIGCTAAEFIDRYLDDYKFIVRGIMLAPPCTHFSRAGNRYYAEKDANGKTAEGLAIVYDCLNIVKSCPNIFFWCLENPVGRLGNLVKLGLVFTFQPCEYAGLADDPEWESYNKRTCLYGDYEYPIKEPENKRPATDKSGFGAVLVRLGKDTPETKEIRSITPQGFSRAFAYAQLRRML